MNQWVNLTTCFGDGVQNPSDEQLRASLNELFQSISEPTSFVIIQNKSV